MSNSHVGKGYDAANTSNYIGKTQGFGVVPIQDHTTTEMMQHTVVGLGDRYNIDITGQMKSWKQEETPFLTLLSNLGTGSTNNPYHTWVDEYTGDSWVDIALDDLRLVSKSETVDAIKIPRSGYESTITQQMIAPTASGYQGGSYKFSGQDAVETASTAYLDGIFNMALVKPTSGKIVFKSPTSGMFGTVYRSFNLIRQYASMCEYTLDGKVISFNSNTTVNPLYFAFDDIYAVEKVGESDPEFVVHNFEEVILRIEKVEIVSNNSVDSLVFTLNVKACNEAQLQNMYAVSLANVAITASTALANPTTNPKKAANALMGYVSHPSRMVMIGLPVLNQPSIPEGDKFVDGGNLNFSRDRKTNLVEIFKSKSYGITGTHQASTFRFGDDFARVREMHMSLYKRQINYKLITGIAGETVASNANSFANGQPVRSLGGFLDYSLFPINYKKVPLPNMSSADTGMSAYDTLNRFVDRIANGTFAFRNSQGSKNITLSCSKAFLRRLSPYVNYALSSNVGMGGTIQIQQPAQMTFGLKLTTFVSTDGVAVNFIHEPALDYMVNFPAAYHQFGKGDLNPQEILLNIDYQNVKKITFRNDRIVGSIQDIGQDAFKEGITGDHTFELNFPKNHGVIWCPTS